MTTDIKIEKVVNDKYVILYKTDEIYIGDIVNKKKNNYGKYFYNQNYYIGEWKDDNYNGEGILKQNNIIYEGQFVNHKFIKGDIKYESGYIYKGEFSDDKKNGYGEIWYKNILICKGIWDNNKLICNDKKQSIFDKNGFIKYIVSSITFIDDKLILPEDESVLELIPKSSIKQINIPKDIIYDDIHCIVYKGYFKNNEYDNIGELYIHNNEFNYRYVGGFKNNKFNGEGCIYNVLSNNRLVILFKGNFENNKIVDTHVNIVNFSIKPYYVFEGEIYNCNDNNESFTFNIKKKKGKFTCYELNIYVEGEWSEFGDIMYETPVNIYKLYNIENVIDQKYSKLLLFKGQRKITTYTGNIYLDNVYFVGNCEISYRAYQIINCTKGKLYLSETNEIISEGNYKFNNINNNYSIELNGIGKKYKNNVLESEGYYVDNKLHNIWNDIVCYTYYSNSNVKISGKFRNNLPHGRCSLYAEDNTLIGIFNYSYGEIIN